MKKNIITSLLACLCSAFGALAETGFSDTVTDWVYVEDGTVYAKVIIENASGVTITAEGESTSVDLKDGVNTITVSLTMPTYAIYAKKGYTLTVNAGDNTYTCHEDSDPVIIDCTKPSAVSINAKAVSSTVMTDIDMITQPRFFNLAGLEVSHPLAGNIYIKVSGSRIEKVRF